MSGFVLWLAEVLVRDCKYVSSETSCLICVGVDRSDGRHKTNPSFHVITKKNFEASAVLIIGINKGVKETHYHNSTLKAFRVKMISL